MYLDATITMMQHDVQFVRDLSIYLVNKSIMFSQENLISHLEISKMIYIKF